MLRQFGPMLFIVMLMLLLNLASSFGPTHGSTYQYSMGPNFSFRENLSTYRLGASYFVTPYTMRDFRDEPRLKIELDESIEDALIRNVEAQCNGAK